MSDSSVQIAYRGGKLNEITMHRPTKATITDCRSKFGGSSSFVSINMIDEEVEMYAYLRPEQAEELMRILMEAFGVEGSKRNKAPVSRKFKPSEASQ